MMDEKPNQPSSDHAMMAPYWNKVQTILGGTASIRKAGKEFLPKFAAETEGSYRDRLKEAKFTNIFRDILENLAQKPFGSEVTIGDEAPEQLKSFSEDVDGRGNNLHVFAGAVFFDGIANAVDWILVDYTRGAGRNATIEEERRAGVRPIWAKYQAQSVLAVYSDRINGREEFTHVRLAESAAERVGWKEVKKERVRVLDREKLDGGGYGPATWTLYEKTATDSGGENWIEIDGGAFSIGVIPLVPFVTGRRHGTSWRFHPPMRDAADLQIEHYQQENGLKNAKNLTAFPMLSGNGVSPVIGDDGKPAPLIVGPATVLYTGEGESGSSSWEFVEPAATSLKFLADDIEATARELRELGRQPLTAQSGNLTVVTTAFAAQKGNSAIQAWALNLKDALENALRFTGLWLNVPTDNATVTIKTDFEIGLGDDDTFQQVVEMRKDGDISREALIHEAKRRGVLDSDYDADADLEAILTDMDGGREDPPS